MAMGDKWIIVAVFAALLLLAVWTSSSSSRAIEGMDEDGTGGDATTDATTDATAADDGTTADYSSESDDTGSTDDGTTADYSDTGSDYSDTGSTDGTTADGSTDGTTDLAGDGTVDISGFTHGASLAETTDEQLWELQNNGMYWEDPDPSLGTTDLAGDDSVCGVSFDADGNGAHVPIRIMSRDNPAEGVDYDEEGTYVGDKNEYRRCPNSVLYTWNNNLGRCVVVPNACSFWQGGTEAQYPGQMMPNTDRDFQVLGRGYNLWMSADNCQSTCSLRKTPTAKTCDPETDETCGTDASGDPAGGEEISANANPDDMQNIADPTTASGDSGEVAGEGETENIDTTGVVADGTTDGTTDDGTTEGTTDGTTDMAAENYMNYNGFETFTGGRGNDWYEGYAGYAGYAAEAEGYEGYTAAKSKAKAKAKAQAKAKAKTPKTVAKTLAVAKTRRVDPKNLSGSKIRQLHALQMCGQGSAGIGPKQRAYLKNMCRQRSRSRADNFVGIPIEMKFLRRPAGPKPAAQVG